MTLSNRLESEQLRRPAPLPFHEAMVRHLKEEEPDLWSWFSSSRKRGEQAEAVRLDLLKSTYRLDRASHESIHALAEKVLARFGLRTPVTLYQAQGGGDMNASLAYLPGEAHVVLTGSVTSALSERELEALLAHELSHFLLFDEWNGDYHTAAELLRALNNDVAAVTAHHESCRLFGLYTEIFADRGACCATGDAALAIATLIKVETGLSEVSAESYLRQAEEIFAKSPPALPSQHGSERIRAEQLTHPESYIRARALKLWAEQGDAAQAEIQRMIEGSSSLARLDLLGQKRVAANTRWLIERLLEERPWLQTESVLAHARLFFDDLSPLPARGERRGEGPPFAGADGQELEQDIQHGDASLRDYYCYVLLDFATVDRDLGEPALAAALLQARRLGLDRRFADIVHKELGLSRKQTTKLEHEAEEIVAKVRETAST